MGINEMIQEERNRQFEFQQELTALINRYSMENICDMPDFIMSEMIMSILLSIGPKIRQNLDWHGCDSVCHQKLEIPTSQLTEEESQLANQLLAEEEEDE